MAGQTDGMSSRPAAAAAQHLPMQRVFVVKLAGAGRRCRGQLEHVASGRRLSFGSARELVEVLRRGVGKDVE